MERGRDSTKELQRPSHALVRRSEGKKPARDAVTRGEAHECSPRHDVNQETYIQGKSSTFKTWLSLIRRSLQCRKTMARIKYVINERRLAYEGAVQIIAENKEREVLTRRELTARRKVAKTKRGETVALQPEVGKLEEPQTAAERAAAGLVQPNSVER